MFSLVFFKVLSALLSVAIGYGAGRYANVDKDSIAKLLFYFVAPIVFFAIPSSASLSISDLKITIVVFTLCSFLVLFSYWIYGYFWRDNHRNILALSAGTGNGGYVGLPIASAMFDDKTLSIYALAVIGIAVCEASVGLYFCIQASTTKRESIIKVLKLPMLNAFLCGCIFSLLDWHLPQFLDDFIVNMKGAFSILGMLMIGLSLSHMQHFNIDIKFTAAAFVSKFLFFPIAFYMFVLIDRFMLHWYNDNYYNAILLSAFAPMATNTIVISSLYKIQPDKVATAVLFSLLFVLIYMPMMTSIFLNNVMI